MQGTHPSPPHIPLLLEITWFRCSLCHGTCINNAALKTINPWEGTSISASNKNNNNYIISKQICFVKLNKPAVHRNLTGVTPTLNRQLHLIAYRILTTDWLFRVQTKGYRGSGGGEGGGEGLVRQATMLDRHSQHSLGPNERYQNGGTK